mgnify:CR=1 FL=1
MGCLTVVIRVLRNAIDVAIKVAETGCVQLSRLGGIVANFNRLNATEVKYQRISADVGVSIGLVCSVGIGMYEYLECSDLGFVRTYDKGFILVPKR